MFFNSAPSMPVPHIRHYDLSESELRAAGYRVLSHLDAGKEGGRQVDIFTRDTPGRSRFVFLQGHPEQHPNALARLHLQEMERFHAGENGERPLLPENYFDRATEDRLVRIGDDLPAYRGVVTNALPRQVWRPHAVRLFGNWLMLVAAAKARRVATRGVSTRRRASLGKISAGLSAPGPGIGLVLAQVQRMPAGIADLRRHLLAVEIQIVARRLVPAGDMHGKEAGACARGQRTRSSIEVGQGLGRCWFPP